MSIDIRVSPARDTDVFYGGDEVCGTVEVRGPLDFPSYDDSKIHIVFTGSSETAHVPKGGSKFTDNAIFFQLEKVLLDGTVDLKKGASQTWQFSFKLPEQTEPDWAQVKIKRKKRCDAFLITPHPIPPSTALSGQTPWPWQARISYSLHAKVSGKWGWREDKRALLVVPKPQGDIASADLAFQSKNFTYSSSQFLPEEAQRKRSVSEWLRGKFARNAAKKVFSIKVHTLQTLTPGHQIPIHLQLDHDTENSNSSPLPELRLLDMRYKIFAKTQIWGDDFLSTATSRELAGRWAPRVQVYSRHLKFNAHFLANGQKISVHRYRTDDGTMGYVILDQALVPPFKTYNVKRSYEAAMSLSFLCGRKKHMAKFEWALDIGFNERYVLPSQLLRGNEDLDDANRVGKLVFEGLITLMTTALGAAV